MENIAILLASAALGWELYALAETGSFRLSSLGDLKLRGAALRVGTVISF